MFKLLKALFGRRDSALEECGMQDILLLVNENGFSGYEWMHEFNAFMADPELSRLLKVSRQSVESLGGALDPGFSMSLVEPQRRLWFLLMVCFSVQNNREALRTLADWAPTDSAALWCGNPPSCPECGSVRPHHQESCMAKPFLVIESDEY